MKYPDKERIFTEEDLDELARFSLSFEKDGILQRVEQDVITRHLYRAKKIKCPATLTLRQWLTTLHYFRFRCAYCLIRPYGILEHFISLTSGGGTTASNCVPACQSCNVRKAQHSLETSSLERVQQYLQTRRNEVMV